ncbi:MAG: cytochrome c [Candidatus Binatia bacterium]|nr:cytochrome c [Candidatus Binatia bacterium]
MELWTRWFLWTALSLAASGALALDGEALYKEKCAKCHGETGKGDTPTGKSMKVPSMVGDPKVQEASAEELMKNIRVNKKHKEPVKKMSDEELQAVIPVIKRLAGASGS